MYRLYVLLAALLFSTGGAVAKALTLTPWQIASFRSAVAVVVLAALLPEARRLSNWRVWLGALAFGPTLVAFILATRLTSAANAIFLQSTAPVYLLPLGPWLLKEKIRRTDYIVIAGLAAGMALIFSGHPQTSATAPNPALGNLFGILSGIFYALTLAALRWVSRDGQGGGLAIATAGNIVACLMAFPLALPVANVAAADIGGILYLGVFQIGLAYFLLSKGMSKVPAFECSTLLLVEPAFNPLWTWLAHGEHPGAASILGGAVILAATLAGRWWSREAPPQSAQSPGRSSR